MTLLELLVVVAMLATITAAVARAYSVGLGFEQGLSQRRDEWARESLFEDRIRELIRGATLSTDDTNPNTFFIGSNGIGANAEGGSEATDLAFTTGSVRLPSRLLDESVDFETDNGTFGPQGGLAEIQLGTTPTGQANGRAGLFVREQRPSDGDPSQGGRERVLTSEVSSMRFEFFDGLTWTALWDTTDMTPKRLPSAVRVTYQLVGATVERSFVVRLPHSDITKDNPLSTGGEATQ